MSNTQKVLAFLLILQLSYTLSPRIIPVKDPNNILFTFGSCNSYYGNEPDDILYRLAELKPDVWVWLGDVAYVDEKIMPPIFGYAGEEKIKATLHKAKTGPAYTALREATNVIGVWDDHDYGLNNAGRSFEHKRITQQLWLDFIDEPKDSARRQREGVYESYYIGDSSKIKVILLDVRYSREDNPMFKSKKNTDTLGEQQWAWLENELANNKAQYVLIGSGVQILPDDRVFPENFFPESRDRLMGLIKKHKVNGVILLSGDVHYAEIMKYPCKERFGYELYEFTSSGLTHHVSSHVPFADKYVKTLLPNTWSTENERFIERNFGVINFSFGKNGQVKFEARDYDGKTALTQTIKYSQLQFGEKIPGDNESYCITDRNRFVRFLENFGNALLKGKLLAYGIAALLILIGLGITKLLIFLFRAPGRIYRSLTVAPKKVKEA